MSPIKNVALVNELGQVINHVVVDTEDTETIAGLHKQWNTVRHVETTTEDRIILHESDEIWTTHCDDPACNTHGFTQPDVKLYLRAVGMEIPEDKEEVITPKNFTEITINGRKYPDDSYLIKENAPKRPAGWVLPEGEVEVSLADKG